MLSYVSYVIFVFIYVVIAYAGELSQGKYSKDDPELVSNASKKWRIQEDAQTDIKYLSHSSEVMEG